MQILSGWHIETITVGAMESNCYVLSTGGSQDAIIVDPGGEAGRIKNCLKENNLKPVYIVNTHGHYDHIAANDAFDVPVLIHEKDAGCLTAPEKNLSALMAASFRSSPAFRRLSGGETLELNGLVLKVAHTPGHTPGSIVLIADGFILTGDTLFCGGVGRTDFPGGSETMLMESIKKELLRFPDDTVIFPGHGPCSTIGEERKNNPFIGRG